jgi:hypothetical protein
MFVAVIVVIFGGTEVSNTGLVVTRKVVYHLNHTSSSVLLFKSLDFTYERT